MSTALYRRYRPDTFAHVIGQSHVTKPLMAALDAGRINHAFLFSGPRGCGKTSSARIMARCLNCAEGPTANPCGKCDSCRELATGGSGSLDVVEIDAASHNGVDDARELRERAAFAPVRDRYKIFILDEAHMVTQQGFNALLKLVEEPPDHIKFIFATTEPEKVIGTIRSRTHHYPFRLVAPEVMTDYLAQLCAAENVTIGDGVAPLVVRAGAGSVRDTLSIMDQLMAGAVDGHVDYEGAVALLGFTEVTLLDEALTALARQDGPALFDLVARVVDAGHDPRRFVEDLLQRMRDVLVIAVGGDAGSGALAALPADQIESLRTQAGLWPAARLSQAGTLTAAALGEMVGATSPRLQLELLCARLLLLPEAGAGQSQRPSEVASPPVGETPPAPVDQASGRRGADIVREMLRKKSAPSPDAGEPTRPVAPPAPAPETSPTAAAPVPASGPANPPAPAPTSAPAPAPATEPAPEPEHVPATASAPTASALTDAEFQAALRSAWGPALQAVDARSEVARQIITDPNLVQIEPPTQGHLVLRFRSDTARQAFVDNGFETLFGNCLSAAASLPVRVFALVPGQDLPAAAHTDIAPGSDSEANQQAALAANSAQAVAPEPEPQPAPEPVAEQASQPESQHAPEPEPAPEPVAQPTPQPAQEPAPAIAAEPVEDEPVEDEPMPAKDEPGPLDDADAPPPPEDDWDDVADWSPTTPAPASAPPETPATPTVNATPTAPATPATPAANATPEPPAGLAKLQRVLAAATQADNGGAQPGLADVDEPSLDDPDVEHSNVVGVPAVEAVFAGAKVIEERKLTDK